MEIENESFSTWLRREIASVPGLTLDAVRAGAQSGVEDAFFEGLDRGAILAAKALLEAKVSPKDAAVLVGKHWDLRPSETEHYIRSARAELKRDNQ